ncbi:hypothetical protein roselon_02492 [Roseibacterium elongatum DSM 19469]|uniref:Uncharacterized protein n=1 Tax=Roseicyclus elongatus DSM 19469 TaxID=1294273 RepID=W8RUA6_9RHOB|nr:hypothetical protein [Roseibacterium elongatum]AHM04813.1 hypothetical protein roselon_02492 [Roseibacterium elongatum DSM 19469]
MRGVAILGAAAMLAGGALPWVDVGLGMELRPFDALQTAWRDYGIELPREMAVLGASFLLAGLALLMALAGRPHRGLTFFAGALPWGYVGWQLWRAEDQVAEIGLSLTDFRGIFDLGWDTVRQVAELGLYLYWLGAAAVLLAGLVGFGRHAARA